MEYLQLLEIVEEMELVGIARETTVLYLYMTGRGVDGCLSEVKCAELLGISRDTIQVVWTSIIVKTKGLEI